MLLKVDTFDMINLQLQKIINKNHVTKIQDKDLCPDYISSLLCKKNSKPFHLPKIKEE